MMRTSRFTLPLCLVLAAPAAWGQVALRSVTSARQVTVTHGAPAKEEASAASAYDDAPASATTPAAAERQTYSVRAKVKADDPGKDRAAAMFSKFLLAFNDKEHGKRIMAQQGPSYRLEDWHYFPVRIKSLTRRKVEDQVIMVNPTTGKYQLEGAQAKAEEG